MTMQILFMILTGVYIMCKLWLLSDSQGTYTPKKAMEPILNSDVL